MNIIKSRRLCHILPLPFLFLGSCGGGPDAELPSRLKRFPADLSNPKLEAAGIYSDAWAAENISVFLRQPGGEQVLTVRGMVPGLGSADFQTTVELRVDDNSVGKQEVGLGDFRITTPVATGAGKRHVEVMFHPYQLLPAGDGRRVGSRLQFIGFEPAKSATVTVSPDIVRGSRVQLGHGWGVFETFRKETFRWVDNDAQIRIQAAQAEGVAVSMMVEPGPGIGGKPFVLKIFDRSGRQVGAVSVKGRSRVKFTVPVEAGKLNEFVLHVDGGGQAARNDRRILNFRVFRIDAG
jgi:hypothetical protein